jgi:putative spermidine/putrescine transport system permease protein
VGVRVSGSSNRSGASGVTSASSVSLDAPEAPKLGPRRLLATLGANRWSLLVLPGVAVLLIFFAYPTAAMLRRSVTEFAAPQVSGLDNFRWFFDTSVNVTVLKRTAVTAVAVTGICLIVGYPYAYLATKVGLRLRLVMLGVIIAADLSSLLVRSYAWLILLQAHGPVKAVTGIELAGTTTGVMIAMVQLFLPLIVLPLYANMRGIDRRLLAAAQSLGARPPSAFFGVYLPLSLPGILAGALLVFVFTVGFYVTPTIVGGPQNALISQLIVTQVDQLLAFGRAGAMSVILLAMTLITLMFVARIARSRLAAAGQQEEGGLGSEDHRRSFGTIALGVIAVIIAVWLLVPMLVVIPISFSGQASLAFPPTSWSTQWYSRFFTDPEWNQAVVMTLKVGILSTIVATVIGTATSFGLVRGRFPGKAAVNAFVLSPMIVPGVVTAIGIYAVFLQWRLVGTTFGFVAAHSILALPWVVIPVSAVLATFDRRLEDAAASLGAGPLKTFATVTLPSIRPGILAGAALAFATSFDETVVSLFLATSRTQTLPVQIYNGITRTVDPTIAAASSLLLLLTSGAVVVAVAVQGRTRDGQAI